MSVTLKLATSRRLGIQNVARVALYRLGLKTKLHPAVRVSACLRQGSRFFAVPKAIPPNQRASLPISQRWDNEALFFGWYSVPLNGRAPDWHANGFTGKTVPDVDRPWYEIPDFDSRVGDIKTVWEASRFDWVVAMAERACAGNEGEVERLNTWLGNWCQANPPYRGPNWKCGQEASIRVMHLAVAAHILGQDAGTQPGLLELLETHLRRIYPTVSYAVAQDNNHGTSEAVGLFIGGEWCYRHGVESGAKWMRAGRDLLENRVRRLVADDGSFSQYSTNYHRLFLDSLCLVELWRRWHGAEPFSELFYDRARAATEWLYDFVDPETGDAPNLGANDGARILPITDSDYRDYRPTVQLASALFLRRRAYPEGKGALYNAHLEWLGVPVPKDALPPPGSSQRRDGGYALLRRDGWFALFRYPRFRFRPSHCDALHVDLWHDSKNLLRDGGSYSYSADSHLHDYFTGTASHNTIQFDNRDQMPSLGRFLRGAWLEAHNVEEVRETRDGISAAASYRDYRGAVHERRLTLDSTGVTVHDSVRGFSERAVLRWRLQPGDWLVDGHTLRCGAYTLEVKCDVPVQRFELTQGWESRYYMQLSPLPVLEVEIRSPGTLTTRFGVRPQ